MKLHDDLINNLDKKIPPLIKDLGTALTNVGGYIRFDKDSVSSIYVSSQPFKNCNSMLLKFSYDLKIKDFKFKQIYIVYNNNSYDVNNPVSIIQPDDRYSYEFRYDSNLELNTTYKHYNRYLYNTEELKKSVPDIFDYKNKRLKIAEKDDVIYWESLKRKSFKMYFDFLKTNNFIDNCSKNTKFRYGYRSDVDSIYLII